MILDRSVEYDVNLDTDLSSFTKKLEQKHVTGQWYSDQTRPGKVWKAGGGEFKIKPQGIA